MPPPDTSLLRPVSLKSRLALWVLLPVVLLTSVDVVLVQQSAERTATLVQQQLLFGSARMISEQLVYSDGDYEITIPPAAFEIFRSRTPDRVLFSVHSKDGQLIAGDDELAPYAGALRIEEEQFFVGELRGEPVRVVVLAHALPNSSSGDFAVTQVAQTMKGHDEFREGLLRSTLRGHLVLLVITCIALALAIRWTLRPLIAFGQALENRRSGSLEQLAAGDAPTELAPVIHALNDYVVRLDRTLASYEKFVANTAHQLRNSFAIIATQLQFGKRAGGENTAQTEVFGAIEKTLTQCTRATNQLLTLASIEQLRQEPPALLPAGLAEAIVAAIDEAAPLARQRGIELGVDEFEGFDASLRVAAPQRLLHEVFANLIGNAIRHMDRPGLVTASLRREGDRARFRLVDEGPGIAPELRERVFERFFRVDETKPDSSGLGLAIVKEACDFLGARIALATPASGRGLRVDIDFPALPREV
jgi:two-component system sensor histidine kinase TctE